VILAQAQGVETRKSRLCRKFKSTKLICFTTTEPLLLIAGFNSDSSSWSAMMPALVKLSDHPTGQSRSWALRGGCRSTARLFRHSPGACSRSFHGGQIAQELALLHTENVRSLILLSSWQREIVSFRLIELLVSCL